MSPISLRTSCSILLATICVAVPAFAGSPRLTHVYPSGGQRGAEIEVVCSGSNLGDARELLFSSPGFKGEIVKSEKAEEMARRLKVKITVPSEARLGEHSFRVVTESGISDLRLFYVTPFPMVEEQPEDKEAPDKIQPVTLGTSVYGRTQGEDVDRFQIDAKKGERISAEIIAARLQTQQIFDTAITISKADGTAIAQVDDVAFSRQDPVVSVVAPEDGAYIVTVKDVTNSGTGECHYLLNIGTFPRPLAVYPPGGMAGEEVKFTLIGDATGPIQRTVKLPEEPIDKYELFTEDGQPAPQPNLVRVSPFPNVLEVEPNNTTPEATPAGTALPLALNGVIEAKDDVDVFKFTAKKGVDYDLNVYARRLRSPLDAVLTVYGAKGNRLANNDDAGGPDSYLRWKAPEDGEYFLQINDQLMRGGPTFTYRVEITTVAPRITAWLPEMVQNSNQERRAIVVPKGNRYASLVRVKREDIGGDLQLVPEGLPAGVKVHAGTMDKSVDTTPMVFEAAPDAPPASAAVKIQPNLLEPPKDGPAVFAGVEHPVDVAENGNQRSFYAVEEQSLPAAVVNEVPVKLELIGPKVPILQSGSMNLKVKAERQGDFKGAINLALLYSPPGIGTAGTAVIKEGENEGIVTISANGNAPLQKWKICVIGSADTGKGVVWISTSLVDLEVAAPFVSGKLARTFVDQGDEGSMTLALEMKQEFEGKAKLELLSLPNGVTAEPAEITKDSKEAKFKLTAKTDAQAGQHKQVIAQFTLEKDGEPMVNTIASGGILRVDKAAVAQK